MTALAPLPPDGGAVEFNPIRGDSLAGGWRTRLKQDADYDGECWIWRRTTTKDGYAKLSYGLRYEQIAHRLSYRLFVGPIPAGYSLDHLCRRRNCINPKHLEPVTWRENILRGQGIAAERARQTHCKHGHELTPENTYTPPSKPTKRECRACRERYAVERAYRRRYGL